MSHNHTGTNRFRGCGLKDRRFLSLRNEQELMRVVPFDGIQPAEVKVYRCVTIGNGTTWPVPVAWRLVEKWGRHGREAGVRVYNLALGAL